MTSAAPIPPITGTVTVAVPQARAFELFTGKLNSWWPHQFHIGAADVEEVILEPQVGGRWYERGVDGSQCDWGRVLAWEPPDRVVFTWQINGMWQFDPNPEHASEIEARFRADGPDATIVDVEHRYFERLVAGQNIHQGITGGGGWAFLVDAFAKMVADQR